MNELRITPSTATQQAALDPLRPTARDGWSPDRITVTESRNDGGFIGSALNFTLGGVAEQPGQRLSTGMVDQLAPYFATTFGIDETVVRAELAKVYVYVGGPAPVDTAMTIGHHVFVDDEQSLRHIMSPAGRNWLTHELTHTMQFTAYHESSPHRFLADYLSGLVMGIDPATPGSGTGPPVWGALFTGLRAAGAPEDALGEGASTPLDRAQSSVLPAAVVGVPIALAAGGGLAAARATTGLSMLGSMGGYRTGLGVIALPALAGAAAGAVGDQIGAPLAQGLGAVAGGAIAGTTLLRGGAFHGGRASALGAAAATLGGAAGGWLTSAASANTVTGWSRNADVLADLPHPRSGTHDLSYSEALHDAHWQEIDAEAAARGFTRGSWQGQLPADGAPVAGRIPDGVNDAGDLGDQIDWGVKLPLLVGVPLAVAAGSGVLASRVGTKLLSASVREGKGPIDAARAALKLLGSSRSGVVNSLAVGAAVTVAPLVAGGVSGAVTGAASDDATRARVIGAAAGGVVGATLVGLLNKGRGLSTGMATAQLTAGTLVSGGLGLISGSVAADAQRPHERTYVPAGADSSTLP